MTTGGTNREVAPALLLSEETVGSHQARSYDKLGALSRAALAAILAREADPRKLPPPADGPRDRAPPVTQKVRILEPGIGALSLFMRCRHSSARLAPVQVVVPQRVQALLGRLGGDPTVSVPSRNAPHAGNLWPPSAPIDRPAYASNSRATR